MIQEYVYNSSAASPHFFPESLITSWPAIVTCFWLDGWWVKGIHIFRMRRWSEVRNGWSTWSNDITSRRCQLWKIDLLIVCLVPFISQHQYPATPPWSPRTPESKWMSQKLYPEDLYISITDINCQTYKQRAHYPLSHRIPYSPQRRWPTFHLRHNLLQSSLQIWILRYLQSWKLDNTSAPCHSPMLWYLMPPLPHQYPKIRQSPN